jgi:hypothetical protein
MIPGIVAVQTLLLGEVSAIVGTTLADVTLSATAVVPVKAALAKTLDNATLSAAGGHAWTTTFSATLNADSDGWNGVNLRQQFAAAALSTSGGLVRITLQAGSSQDAIISSCYIGHAAGAGDAYDFDGTQVQVTFGGSAGVTIPANSSVVSDLIPYSFDEAKNFIVAAYFNGGTSHDMVRANTSAANTTKYEKTAADETSTANVTGYSSAAGLRLINKIEVAS